jgi:hypothetical protein
LCSVSQAEAHEKVHKQSKWRDDGGFGDVGGGDGYLMVSFDEVDLAEDGATVEAIGKVLHVRQGVPCDGVEPPVVAAGSPGAVLLGHHVEGGRPSGVGPADDTCCLEFFELGFGDAQLVGYEAACFGENRAVSACVDAVLDAVCWRWCECF